MSLLDRLITLDLLDITPALAKVENPEQVQEAVLREIGGALEAAGAELRQLQRSRDTLLQNRREAEKESDEKQLAAKAAAEVDKANLTKQTAALEEALVRLDEQIAEQNREEATLHKYVTRLQEIRRETSEWSPRRHSRSEPKVEAVTNPEKEPVKEPSQEKEPVSKSSNSSRPDASSTSSSTTEAAAPKVQEKERAASNDPFYKMTRLKEKMDAFQARTAIDEEELQAFLTEKAIAEEETRMVIEQNLSELKKKMNNKE